MIKATLLSPESAPSAQLSTVSVIRPLFITTVMPRATARSGRRKRKRGRGVHADQGERLVLVCAGAGRDVLALTDNITRTQWTRAPQ